jgi:hypothetical protein
MANGSLAMARAVIAHSGLSRRDVLLGAAPLQGGVGFINAICSVALTGCTLVIAPDLAPARCSISLPGIRSRELPPCPRSPAACSMSPVSILRLSVRSR